MSLYNICCRLTSVVRLNLMQCLSKKHISCTYSATCGPGSSVDWLRAGRSGIESRWWRNFPYLSRPTLGTNQPPVKWVPGLSPGVKNGRGVTLTSHPILVHSSWKGRAIPLLPLWALRPVQSLSACTKVTFTFNLILHHVLTVVTLPPCHRIHTTFTLVFAAVPSDMRPTLTAFKTNSSYCLQTPYFFLGHNRIFLRCSPKNILKFPNTNE